MSQKVWKLLSDQTSSVAGTVTYTQDAGSDYDAYVVLMSPLTAASGACELKGIDNSGTEFTLYLKTGIAAGGHDGFASIGKGVKTVAINNMRSMPTCFPLKWNAVAGATGTIRLRIYGINWI